MISKECVVPDCPFGKRSGTTHVWKEIWMTPDGKEAHDKSCSVDRALMMWIMSWIPVGIIVIWLLLTEDTFVRWGLLLFAVLLIGQTFYFKRRLLGAEEAIRQYNRSKGRGASP